MVCVPFSWVGLGMDLRFFIRCRQFFEDTYGGITALTLTVFIVMMVSVGMAVDFMRHETYRVELQDALDRGVLAAAAFDQTIGAEETVRSYLKSTNFVKDCYQLDLPVSAVTTTGSRTITASATCELDTFFLKLVGMPKLDVKAIGSAIEGASMVEVSLVLDISTSMVMNNSNGTNETRLQVLKTSANQFLDRMFVAANNDRLSLSLIPFSGQVNAGPTAFNHFNSSRTHNYSNCIEFDSSDANYVANGDSDFTASSLNTMTRAPSAASRDQTQHFNYSVFVDYATNARSHGPIGVGNVGWGWCPSDTQQIAYHQTDKDALKARINAMEAHEATGTYYGARWGAMLLDPTSNDLTGSLIAANEVDSDQSAVPRAFGDPEVQKFLILMGDGATTGQVRVVDDLYDNTPSFGSVTDPQHWASNLSSNQWNDFEYVGVDGNPITQGQMLDGTYTFDAGLASRDAARQAFLDVCETSKDNGVVVFTIGFDLEPDPNTATQSEIDSAARARADLGACATSNFFYDVNGTGLQDAFAEIAATIQKLRLVN